jgi:NTE family protein
MGEPTRALVLAGGGVGGIAWELGLVAGLHAGGADVTRPDLIVGTSAGSAVGTQIATGVPLADLAAMQLSDDTAELSVDLDVEAYRARVADLVAGAPDRATALARLGRMALEADTVAEPVRREVIAARLPVQDWPPAGTPDRPRPRLALTAIDALTGELWVIDRDAGVPLVDAVAASCAVPGVWPPVTIGDRRCIDGGMRSYTNADLAGGHDRVLVAVPTPVEGPVADQLDAELASLDGAATMVVAVDTASIDAIGPNALDASRRPLAYRAGKAQGEAAADRVRAFWA